MSGFRWDLVVAWALFSAPTAVVLAMCWVATRPRRPARLPDDARAPARRLETEEVQS